MAKELTFNEEMRRKLFEGIKLASDAAAETLGPAGRNVLIEKTYGAPLTTKDGVTVLKEIELEDPIQNMGAKLVAEASDSANNVAGDGSTTTAILTEAIVEEGLKAVQVGVNPIHLKRGINKAVADTIKELKALAKEIESKEEIVQVASISANNDEEIGALIADAIDKVGSEGVITVGDSRTIETTTTVVEGMAFDRGYISPYFCTDKENLKVELDDAYVLVYNKSISNVNAILPILDKVIKENSSLLIIADDVEGEALAALALNALKGVVRVCAVKAPGFGDRKKAMLEDIATLVGGALVDEEIGYSLERHGIDCLGKAGTVKVDRDTTTIIDGFGDPKLIEDRVNQIKRDVEEATSDYDREKAQERLARLSGGVAVINVGATTEGELKEKKFRLEDSLNATRSAIAEGIIPGGGSALAYISKRLSEKISDVPVELKEGYTIVLNALMKPMKRIAENAGVSGEVVVSKALELNPCEFDASKVTGYNALTDEYCKMLEAGVIDPVKVTRSALENASSVAILVLTSNCAINTKAEDEKPYNPAMEGMSPM